MTAGPVGAGSDEESSPFREEAALDSKTPSGEAVEELVRRAQRGDQAAFAELYRTRLHDVGRYAATILRNVDRAEDVAAQTFLNAWKSLPALRDPLRFDAWLFRIAHNLAVRELQRRPTEPVDRLGDLPDPSPFSSPSAQLDSQVDAERMRAALVRIPNAQREVLVLRFLRDLSHAEVATHVGKKVEAVRALQYRGLRSLRSLMEADEAS